MAFEYNGVVYRDLEPQVRYDAEQVQLLKQADVTINENLQTVNESLQTVNESLQTVNTEINGKLTAPTTPTAESAVTMLADGTVGTKPLSEIGGGKLYLHKIDVSKNGLHLGFNIYCSIKRKLTKKELNTFNPSIASLSSSSDNGVVVMDMMYSSVSDALTIDIIGVVNNGSTATGYNNNFVNPNYTDTLTEI